MARQLVVGDLRVQQLERKDGRAAGLDGRLVEHAEADRFLREHDGSDLMEPELFGLEDTASDGSRQQTIMIHRALFGSIERFFGCGARARVRNLPSALVRVRTPLRET